MSDDILGKIIWIFCVGGCGLLIDIIGYFFSRKDEPCSIYSGKTIDKSAVRDIPEYNKAVAKILYKYSIPFYISMVLYFFSIFLAVAVVILASTLGIIFIIREYKKVEKEFIYKGDF